MMRILAVCCLAALTAACSKTPETPAAQTPAVQAPPAQAPAASKPAPAPATQTAAVSKVQYLLPFTSQAEQGAPEDPRIVRWTDGPCGATPFARVASIPLDDKSLLADYVVEFDPAGRELRRWGKPYEAEVLAVEGEWLRVAVNDLDGKPHELRIDLAGRIEPIADPAQAQPKTQALSERSKMIDCPKLPTFAESDYEQCYDVTDAAGAHRRLAYEGVCA